MGFTFTQVPFAAAAEVRSRCIVALCGSLGWIGLASRPSNPTTTTATRTQASGSGGGGRRNRQAAEEAGGDQDVKYPGTQQVSQVGLVGGLRWLSCWGGLARAYISIQLWTHSPSSLYHPPYVYTHHHQDVLKDHEQNKFVQLPQAQQDQAVGAAVRFILFKGKERWIRWRVVVSWWVFILRSCTRSRSLTHVPPQTQTRTRNESRLPPRAGPEEGGERRDRQALRPLYVVCDPFGLALCVRVWVTGGSIDLVDALT